MIERTAIGSPPNNTNSQQVTVLAPTPQDAKYCGEILREHGVCAEFVTSIYDVTTRIRYGAGVLLIAQEFLTSEAMERLRRSMQEQPSWSDVPVLVLLNKWEASSQIIEELLSIGHVTLIERPLRIALLVSTLKAKLRDRMRQYEVRDLLLEAQQASESKSAFVANMSHEIRTPMTSILGYTELMSNLVENEEAMIYLSTIRRNGEFLLGIINDILDLSRIEAGKLEIDIQRFDLIRLIEDVRSIMALRATERGLKLDVEYESKIPRLINTDPKRLKQILINLVGNAIKFTKNGGVKISVKYKPTKYESVPALLLLSVTDSGIGMTSIQQNRLFKPFSQGDSVITKQFGGTGLGLDISQRLAMMLGGKIKVRSTINEGSTFTVSIATDGTDEVQLIQPTDVIEPAEPSKELKVYHFDAHILIVDDRRDIRYLSKMILSKAGAKITEAEDGLVAINKAKLASAGTGMFDLILLDMHMPNMDGYETAATLRRSGYKGPIIALTADAMQGDMHKCLAAGCNDYLSKPIDRVLLLQKVDELLEKEHSRQANAHQ